MIELLLYYVLAYVAIGVIFVIVANYMLDYYVPIYFVGAWPVPVIVAIIGILIIKGSKLE